MRKKTEEVSEEGQREAKFPMPSEFMRERRPELFSDSVGLEELILERSRLEYHLHSLTSRSEEKQFEHYCRQLCEKLICPNLRPQTGPTGGGDSKVDSDTHAVATSIAERWYVGQADEKGEALYAFAFSAMRDWARKLKADVASIVSTGRPYTRIYFVSNQLIPDKRKGKAEDELSRKHGIPVTVLDGTWLVDKTLSAKHTDIAVATLGIGDFERMRSKNIGTKDFGRAKRLQELEAQIIDPQRYGPAHYQLVEDCIEAALLDRGLGSPRDEVSGRFERAIRLAGKFGVRVQLLRAKYLEIWTNYWWFDDLTALRKGFLDLTSEFLEDATVWDIDYLVNLAIAVRSSCRVDGFEPSQAHQVAVKCVVDALEVLAARKGQPTQAAWARTLLLFLRLLDELRAPDRARLYAQFRQILKDVTFLPEYPIDSLLNWLAVLLEVAPMDTDLARIAEDVANVKSTRAGVAAKVEVRVNLAINHLERDEPYEAISQLGKAQSALRQYRSIDDQAWLWRLCARAYRKAGLAWAARSTLVCATNTVFNDFLHEGELSPRAVAHAYDLMWRDIELGNIPTALQWLDLWGTLHRSLKFQDGPDPREGMPIQAAFALAALRSNDKELDGLAALPEIFRAFSLPFPTDAALTALGYEADVAANAKTTEEDVLRMAALLLKQPLAMSLNRQVEWRLGETIELRSEVLGTTIRVVVEAAPDPLMFAEGFLGFFEAMLATGFDRGLCAHRDEIQLSITTGQGDPLSWSLTEDECGESHFSIGVAGDATAVGVQNPEVWVRLAMDIVLQLFHLSDATGVKQLFGPGDGGLDRAASLTNVPLMLSNLLGSRYPSGRSWIDTALARLNEPHTPYPKKRIVPLADVLPTVELSMEEAKAEPPYIAHSKLATSGLINLRLWDRAKWRGMFYAIPEGASPVLGLLFENAEAGTKIFRGWRKRLGERDENDQLQIATLLGIDKKNPWHYRGVVSSSFAEVGRGEGKIFASPARLLTMEPPDDVNRQRFLKALEQFGQYLVAPVSVGPDGPVFDFEVGIEKRRFDSVPAWTVGLNNQLAMGMLSSDKPIIPAEQTSPPCAELFGMMRSSSMGSVRRTRPE